LPRTEVNSSKKMIENQRAKIAILDVSDHGELSEDVLFRSFMFLDSFCECSTFHVALNQWPENIKILTSQFDGVIITGSEDCCMDDTLPYIKQLCSVVRELVELNFPVLGVCFGAQTIVRALFGDEHVSHLKNLNVQPEFGYIAIEFTEHAEGNEFLKGIEKKSDKVAFYSSSSHSDCFLVKPSNDKMVHLMKSPHWEYQGYQIKDKLCYGIQFHPEMDLIASQKIFHTIKHVPIIHDDNQHEPDMKVGVLMAKNFCEMALKSK